MFLSYIRLVRGPRRMVPLFCLLSNGALVAGFPPLSLTLGFFQASVTWPNTTMTMVRCSISSVVISVGGPLSTMPQHVDQLLPGSRGGAGRFVRGFLRTTAGRRSPHLILPSLHWVNMIISTFMGIPHSIAVAVAASPP